MKRKLKGLLLTVLVILGVFGLAGCSSSTVPADSVKTLTEDEIVNWKNTALQYTQIVVALDDASIEQYLQTDDAFTVSAMEAWKGSKEELGAFKQITSQGVVEDGEEVTVTSLAEFEKANGTVVMTFSLDGTPSAMTINVEYSFGQTMERAAMNTVMGIGIVFLMLIFLSILISQFKHIGKLEAKFTKKAETPAPAPAPAPVAAAVEEEDVTDDAELVAVIAAAIAASENTSTDSFRVRSIKKSNARKWKRA